MPRAHDPVRLFTAADVPIWYQSVGRAIFLGDVVDPSNGDTMSVGFARYAPGVSNDWVVSYDEVLIVTKGAFTVAAEGRRTTARAGELIVLSKGTKLTYSAEDIGAELIYVTYPHWVNAQQDSEHAALMDSFQPVSGIPGRSRDGVQSVRETTGVLRPR